jgi:hypothetical protein
MNPTTHLFGSLFACAQTAIFSAKPCSKNAGETSIVLWIIMDVSKEFQHRAIPIKIEQDSMQTVSDLNKQEDGLIFA